MSRWLRHHKAKVEMKEGWLSKEAGTATGVKESLAVKEWSWSTGRGDWELIGPGVDWKEAAAGTWTLGLEWDEGHDEGRRNTRASEVYDGDGMKSWDLTKLPFHRKRGASHWCTLWKAFCNDRHWRQTLKEKRQPALRYSAVVLLAT